MADLLYQENTLFLRRRKGRTALLFCGCGKEGLAISEKQGTIVYDS